MKLKSLSSARLALVPVYFQQYSLKLTQDGFYYVRPRLLNGCDESFAPERTSTKRNSLLIFEGIFSLL